MDLRAVSERFPAAAKTTFAIGHGYTSSSGPGGLTVDKQVLTTATREHATLTLRDHAKHVFFRTSASILIPRSTVHGPSCRPRLRGEGSDACYSVTIRFDPTTQKLVTS